MSQELSLARLPRDVGHQIAVLLDPLSRASLGRAFARSKLTFSFTRQNSDWLFPFRAS
jgi:hypothetical protein